MSVKIMGIVWESNLPRNQKMVLLSYADHADHNGSNVYPSVGLMAWKTGYSERAIQSITRELEEANILISTGTGPQGTNRFRINCEALPDRAPYGGGEKFAPPAESAPGGVQKSAEGGAETAPEPSVNHQLNNNARELVQRFEKKTGYAPPHETTDQFKEKWLGPFERVLSKAEGDLEAAWLHINSATDALWSKGYHISDPASVYKPALMELHHANADKGNPVRSNADDAWAIVEEAFSRGDGTMLKDHPRVLDAVNAIGGWGQLKQSRDRDIPFVKKRFAQEYANART